MGVGGGHRGPVVLLGDGRVARLSLSLSILLDVLSLVFSLCLTAPGQGQQLPCTQVPACGGEKLSKSGGGDAVEKLWVAELGAVGCPPPHTERPGHFPGTKARERKRDLQWL